MKIPHSHTMAGGGGQRLIKPEGNGGATVAAAAAETALCGGIWQQLRLGPVS